jgi:hypothetical protein
VSTLRIIGDEILLDGVTVGTLVPGLRLSQRDRLEEAFDELAELDEDDLDEEIERLIRAMAEARRPSLAARMRRARMRLVQKPDSRADDTHPSSPGERS